MSMECEKNATIFADKDMTIECTRDYEVDWKRDPFELIYAIISLWMNYDNSNW